MSGPVPTHRLFRRMLGGVSWTAMACVLAQAAHAQGLAPTALPQGGTVASGRAAIATTGAAMTVTQGSSKAIVNWQSFDVGSAASVTIRQPDASSVILNRVTGAAGSTIEGKVNANGQVYLVNPNGVLFGKGAQVSVGGLVASTHNITDANFNDGKRVFEKDGATGKVVNNGTITAASGGSVALIAGTVKNKGAITAPGGDVVLAAGAKVVLDAGANGHLTIEVDPDTVNTLVKNRGIVAADGGQVLMTSQAAGEAVSSVVANTGTVQARTLGTQNGRIQLLADMQTGTAKVDGTLDASAPASGDGGFIETSAAKVKTAPAANITTLAATGQTGTWLIDPNDFTIAPAGGDITGTDLETDLNTSNLTIRSSQGGSSGNGDIIFNDLLFFTRANTILTLVADRNITFTGSSTLDANNGTLNLIADSAGTGVGTVSSSGAIQDATVNAYYHPTGNYGTLPVLGLDASDTLNPYILISNVAQLQRMSENLGGNYLVNADIDASGVSFVPVGTVGAPFTGTFDGRSPLADGTGHVTISSPSHVINSLTINQPSGSGIGLFGVSSGTISNIGLADASITGRSYVGALAGRQTGGTISNAFSSGTVSATAGYAGGLAGALDTATISSSYSAASVTGPGYTGGLAGMASGVISDSYSTGPVSGTYAGGLVGLLNASGSLSDVYSSAPVSGIAGAGGLVGSRDSMNPAGNVSNAYWDADTSQQSGGVALGSASGMIALSGSAAFSAASYAGFDFTSTWWSVNGDTRPVLRSEYGTTIHTPHQLQMMALDLGGNYTLANDLDLTPNAADIWNTATGFVPVGNDSTRFTGTFDGQGHVIDGLTIDRPSATYVGLFGATSGADIRNIGLINTDVTGDIGVGGLVGIQYGGSIDTAYSIGTVTASLQDAGGLAGISGGSISNSYAAGTVSGPSFVGGLTGFVNILIGTPSISDSYSTANATASSGTAGGLVGTGIGGSVSRAYSSGFVTGSNAGGVIGQRNGTSFSEVYWDTGTSGQSSGVGATTGATGSPIALSASTAYSQASYAGFDFTNTWWLIAGGTRPVLRSEYGAVIHTPHQLQLMAMNPSAGYTLANDLDLTPNAAEIWTVAAGFVPVGTAGTAFTGSFDGGGHAITDLTISQAAAAAYTGLFGYTSGAVLSDLTLSGGSITGGSDIGALAGRLTNGSVTNVSSSATVTSLRTGEDDVGGLVGTNDGGAITGSSASGAVTGAGFDVGGLVGYNRHGGTISQSYATGDVTSTYTGSSYVGGLVGLNGFFPGAGDGGTIGQSYATGDVTAAGEMVGGFIGYNMGTIGNAYATGRVLGTGGASSIGGFAGVNGTEGTITTAYATGYVTGPSQVGGFAGTNINTSGSIVSAYWNTQTSGLSSGISSGGGSITGKTTAQLQGALPDANFSSSIWATGANLYPYFDWRYPTAPVAVSGNAYSDAGITALAGARVTAVSGGRAVGHADTGANGYYYVLGEADTLNNAGALAYLDNGSAKGAAFSDVTGTNGVQNLSIYGGAVHLITGAATLAATQANYTATFGSYADSDLSFLSGSTFAPLTTIAGYGIYLDAAGSYTLNTTLGSSGLLSLGSGGTFGVSGTIGLSAAGDITIKDAVAWSDASTLILATTAGGNLTFGGDITAANGALTLSFGGSASPVHAVGVKTFTLNSGTWSQVAATLPSFSAADFRLAAGATFLRAEGGDGSAAAPYRIADVYGLQGMASTSLAAQSFTLTQDIDASGTANWNSAQGFVPIGSTGTPFTGLFDGAGHAVSGLTIAWLASDDVGLFGVLGGTVRDVALAGGTVAGRSNVGALAGWNTGAGSILASHASTEVIGASSVYAAAGGLVGLNDGSIANAYATGDVTGNGAAVGGLAGGNTGTIDTAYATGAIQGTGVNVGGLVGSNSGSISGAFATGDVTGTSQVVGGLAGGNSGMVSDSYATGTVTGPDYVGGLIGGNSGTVGSSYAAASVVAVGANAGGLIGSNAGTVTASFWDTLISGRSTGGAGDTTGMTGLITAGMTDLGRYTAAGWDIDDAGGTGKAWRIYDGHTAPLLRSFMTGLTVTGGSSSKTYDGGAISDQVGTLTYSPGGYDTTLVHGTAFYRADSANAGSYSGATLGLGGLYSSQFGYDITAVAGTLTIDRRALTVSATGIGKTYDGTAAAAVTYGDDRVSGDVLTIAGMAAFDDGNAGNGKNISVSGITVTGADADNYTWNSTATATADIGKRALTITADAVERIYGDANPAIGTATGDNLVAGDSIASVALLTPATVASNAGSYDLAGTGASGTGLSNYDITYAIRTGGLTIDPRLVTVASLAAASKVYDATTLARITGSTLANVVAGDDVALTIGGANFDTADAGMGKTVTASGLGLTGAKAGNYTLDAASAAAIADIDPRLVTVASVSAANKVYDGTALARITGSTLANVVAGDDVALTVGAANFDSADAGMGKTVTASGLGLTGTKARDYTLGSTTMATTQADIIPAAPVTPGVPDSLPVGGVLLNAAIQSAGAPPPAFGPVPQHLSITPDYIAVADGD